MFKKHIGHTPDTIFRTTNFNNILRFSKTVALKRQIPYDILKTFKTKQQIIVNKTANKNNKKTFKQQQIIMNK